VDTTKTITHVSLCAGYGGIDLGLKRAIPNLRTVAFSEIEAYACANLVAKMEKGLLDAAPIWTNLKTFPWAEFRGKVDILSGGYPCQPFSTSGKRLGTEDPRHLWPFIADGIRAMQPKLCFFENVEGHITLGLKEVISELESIGYRTTWGIFSAAEVGAPHRRKRIFIMAHSMRYGSPESWKLCQRSNGQEFSSYGESRGSNVADSEGWKSWESSEWQGRQDISRRSKEVFYSNCENVEGYGDNACGIQTQYPVVGDSSWWQTERGLGRVAHGNAYWVDRLRLCGNGVVPATATLAFQTLLKRL
jgi:DNA (cytosine-5)-methyltransferase 1